MPNFTGSRRLEFKQGSCLHRFRCSGLQFLDGAGNGGPGPFSEKERSNQICSQTNAGEFVQGGFLILQHGFRFRRIFTGAFRDLFIDIDQLIGGIIELIQQLVEVQLGDIGAVVNDGQLGLNQLHLVRNHFQFSDTILKQAGLLQNLYFFDRTVTLIDGIFSQVRFTTSDHQVGNNENTFQLISNKIHLLQYQRVCTHPVEAVFDAFKALVK